MAEPKISQLARTTELDISALRHDLEALKKESTQANWQGVRERLAVLEDRVTELRKSKEEADRRYWQFVVLFVGGILTLAINLVVSFVRK